MTFSGRLKSKGAGAEYGDYVLLKVSLQNEEITVLEQNKNSIRMLDWSRDSEMILYQINFDLYCMNQKTKDQIGWKVVEGVEIASFSPNSKQIVYEHLDGFPKGIWIYNIFSGKKQQLTDGKNDAYPLWYPDGERILFFKDIRNLLGRGDESGQALYTYSIETGQEVKHLSYHELGHEVLPKKYKKLAWVDPGKIVHIKGDWENKQAEYLYNLDRKMVVDHIQYNPQNPSVTHIYTVKKMLMFVDCDFNQIEIYDKNLNRISKQIQIDNQLLDIILTNENTYICIEREYEFDETIGEPKVRISYLENGQVRVLEDFGYYSGFYYDEKYNCFIYFAEEKNIQSGSSIGIDRLVVRYLK